MKILHAGAAVATAAVAIGSFSIAKPGDGTNEAKGPAPALNPLTGLKGPAVPGEIYGLNGRPSNPPTAVTNFSERPSLQPLGSVEVRSILPLSGTETDSIRRALSPISGLTGQEIVKRFGAEMVAEPSSGAFHQIYTSVHSKFNGKLTATTDQLEILSKDAMNSREARNQMICLIDDVSAKLSAMVGNELTRTTALKAFEQVGEIKSIVMEIEKGTLSKSSGISGASTVAKPAALDSNITAASVTLATLEHQLAFSVIELSLNSTSTQADMLHASSSMQGATGPKSKERPSLAPLGTPQPTEGLKPSAEPLPHSRPSLAPLGTPQPTEGLKPSAKPLDANNRPSQKPL